MSSDDGGPGLTGTGRRHGDGAGRRACAGTAVIEVSHLTKDFCGRTAVADVPFSITSGGVSGFLGPGGAGNVTTVRPPGPRRPCSSSARSPACTTGTSPASGSLRGRTTAPGPACGDVGDESDAVFRCAARSCQRDPAGRRRLRKQQQLECSGLVL
jgi:hypothetical protein